MSGILEIATSHGVGAEFLHTLHKPTEADSLYFEDCSWFNTASHLVASLMGRSLLFSIFVYRISSRRFVDLNTD